MKCSKCGLEVTYLILPPHFELPVTPYVTYASGDRKSFLFRGPQEEFPFRCRAASDIELLHDVSPEECIKDLLAMKEALS